MFFSEWQRKREIDIDLCTIEPEDLAIQLRKFYAEVKTKDGQMMSPSGLRGIRAALHRIITAPPISRDINILADRSFMHANKMFEAMCKQYTLKQNPKQKHYPAIEKGDMKKIAIYLNNYKSSPEKLINSFWFLLCYNFARRGVKGGGI